MAEIRFEGVTKVFGERDRRVEAVKDLSLTIKDGEFMVFVGPSGCGKTTSLRMIAGLEVPTDGDIYIGGERVTRAHPKERGVAMVFQDYALYPHMTVYENMSYALRNLGRPKKEIEATVKESADLLQIGDLLNRRPRELSGGQRQRVALGRAIVRSPKAFLFDEPLSNLDAKLRVQMRVELKELHKRLATTSVYVTHDQVEAMTLGERIAVMLNGVVQQVGPARELYERPANSFVGAFIGTPQMNFLEAEVVLDGGLKVVVNKELALAVPVEKARANKLTPGQKVLAGIRPEDIHDSRTTAERPGMQRVTIQVTTTENLGFEDLVYFRIGKDLLVARMEAEVAHPDGEPVEALWDLNKLHLFDLQTTLSLL